MSNPAVDFLEAFHGADALWTLIAINPDGGTDDRLRTRTFGPGERDAAAAFVEEYNGKWNLYHSVNPVARPINKKPLAVDIARLAYLHVDIDPLTGEDIAEEQARIKELLTTKLPPGIPPPTFVIFSGGGYQAFWKLTEPLELDGSDEAAANAKLWNLQLERTFGCADSVHNIDRIMRLPFTWNVPNKKKLSKGRTKALATVTVASRENVYPLSRFQTAPKVQGDDRHGADIGRPMGGVTVNVTGNRVQLTDVHDLDKYTKDKLPLDDRIKRIIHHGNDPDDTSLDAKPMDDRSVWVFDAVCGMVRAGIPDDIIMSALLDRDFRISDHIYDQKVGAEKYAIRQIERAKDASIDPMLEAINREFAVVLKAGKTVVLFETTKELDDQEVRAMEYLSFDDFCKLYSNRFVHVGETSDGTPKMKPLGKWWLEHPNRRQYPRGIHFKPNGDSDGKYNLWRGFYIAPVPGEAHASFLEHLRDNVCSGNEAHYNYLVKWFAHMIQKPNEVAHVAVVVRGEPGTGKTFAARMVGRLLGQHYITVSSSKHLVGNFNAHLEDKLMILADESVWHGDKASQSVLKTLITENVRMIEHKGFNAQPMPNYTRLFMASNDEQVVNAQKFERRYFVLTSGANRRQDVGYFQKIVRDLEDGGFANLLYYLRALDITDFDPRDFPRTDELRRQQEMSLALHHEWWLNCLLDGKVHPKHREWLTECPKSDAFSSYATYMAQLRASHPLTMTQLLRNLRDVVPNLKMGQRKVEIVTSTGGYGPDWDEVVKETRRVNCYILPPLDDCRKAFEAVFGEQQWDT